MLHRSEMIHELVRRPHWNDKINYLKLFSYNQHFGLWVRNSGKIKKSRVSCDVESEPEISRVHYGCGVTILDGWLNIDLYDWVRPGYKKVNLLNKHPFLDNSISFGFCEDTLEHFNQAESIFFLSEIYRTLIPGGVFRLSFPGLEGVLLRHYSPALEERINEGEFEAYHFWDHLHFYSKAELSLVATHIGYKDVNFVEFGQSKYPDLCNLDARIDQKDLNIYVELLK